MYKNLPVQGSYPGSHREGLEAWRARCLRLVDLGGKEAEDCSKIEDEIIKENMEETIVNLKGVLVAHLGSGLGKQGRFTVEYGANSIIVE